MTRVLALFVLFFASLPFACHAQTQSNCATSVIASFGNRDVRRMADGSTVFISGMMIDADGSPYAYHPDDSGLDLLRNAGRQGDWYGIATDDGHPTGNPIMQGDDDPAPGFYVSTTALEDSDYETYDPLHYVDSGSVPYISLPSHSQLAELGDYVAVVNLQTGDIAYAIVADEGPSNKIGEGSMALAEKLGIDSDPRRGGASGGIAYIVFSGSGDGNPKTPDQINDAGAQLFEKWGGTDRLQQCISVQR